MKKLFSILLTLIIFTSLFSFSANAASTTSNSVRVLTTSSMSEANQFAIDTYQDFLDSHCYFNGTTDNLHACLGSGFMVESISSTNSAQYYLFPIYVNDTVKYVYRVYKYDNQFSGVLSELLANEINAIFKTTSDDVVFIESNENLVVVSNLEYKVIRKDPENKNISSSDISKVRNTFFVESKNRSISSINQINPSDFLSASKSSLTSAFNIEPRATGILTIDYLEDQGSEPWCSGYVTANILRFMTGDSSIRVTDIANYGLVSTLEGFSLTTLQNFSSTKGITMSNYITGEIAPTPLYNLYLSERRPVYLGLQSIATGNRHAVVLHGVDGDYYYIRNPWYQMSETYLYGSYYYPTNSSTVYDPRRYVVFYY